MARSSPFWLREMLKTWLQYVGVGCAFVPSGVVYVLLRKQLGQDIALVISLGIGVVLAKLVWDALDRRITLHGPDWATRLHMMPSEVAMAMVAALRPRRQAAYFGQTALETAVEYHPDVVLLDFGLAHMTGYEVARHLRQQPQTKAVWLIAMTGLSGSEPLRQGTQEFAQIASQVAAGVGGATLLGAQRGPHLL